MIYLPFFRSGMKFRESEKVKKGKETFFHNEIERNSDK